MIRLIVNADDLGSGPGRDRGIFRCFEQGIVTSASLLTNGPSFADAARQALLLGLPAGVHLNLSEGRALSGPIAGLTDRAGIFPGKTGLRTILAAGTFDPEGVRRELTVQVERVLETGLVPSHIDSHQHFFLFPAVTELVLQVGRACGIKAVRLPLPAEPAANDLPAPLGVEVPLYRRLAPPAKRMIEQAGLYAPDGLWGMPYLNRLDRDSLAELLSGIGEGTWELMVHPGFRDAGRPFSGVERERELDALTDPAIRRLLVERNIGLTTFGACVCAS